MNVLMDHPLIIPIGLGVLGLNIVGLCVLLLSRPTRHGGMVTFTSICRALTAETLGTFALVLVGVLAVVAGPLAGGEPASMIHIALAHGLTLTVCLAGLGHYSGGHFNPAVSLGLVCVGRLGVLLGLGYVLAQFAGGMAAVYVLAWLFGTDALIGAIPTAAAEVPVRATFVLEAMGTFVLVLIYFGTALDARGPKTMAAAAVGSALTVGMLAMGPLTGGSLNPVRYLAPALVCDQLDNWLVYLAGSAVGASLAAVLMHFFLLEEAEEFQLDEPDTQEYHPRQAA